MRDARVTAERQVRYCRRDRGGGLWEDLQVAQEILEGPAEAPLRTILGATPSSEVDDGSNRPPQPPSASSSSSSSANSRRGRQRPSFFNTPSSSLPPVPPLNPPSAIAQQQKSLPARHAMPDFMKLLDSNNRVLLVAGATGCGKVREGATPQFMSAVTLTSLLCLSLLKFHSLSCPTTPTPRSA